MLSRRRFLQLAGITLASVSLPNLTTTTLSLSIAAPSLETVYGRALRTTRVFAAPNTASPIVTRLWENTVKPILDAQGGWYRLPEGYVLREQMQPMIAPVERSQIIYCPPFWAEVSDAVSVIHVACDAHSEIIRKIGHGGILSVIDWLPAERPDALNWYGVTDREDGALIGWTQTASWSPVQLEPPAPTLTVAVDANQQQLTIRDGDHVLLTAPISTGRDLLPGFYPIIERTILEAWTDNALKSSWLLHFGDDLALAGVYWHNRFGRTSPGAAIQVTPPLARWLYPRAAEVIVY